MSKSNNHLRPNSTQRKTIRKNLFAWNPHCHWCGEVMLLTVPDGYGQENPHPDFATIEHLSPVEVGGNTPDNLVLAHYKCNR